MERVLDAIERGGNKMPHPAILFLVLCGAVIVLSQILYWADVKATYEVVKPPAVPTEETYYGGSTEPTDVGPTEPLPPDAYEVTTETTKVEGLLTADGVRYLFTSFVSNFRNFSAMTIMLVVMIGVGLAEAAGLITLAHPQARRRVVEGDAHVHHRAAGGDLQHRLGRGLPRAHPVRCGGLQERGQKPAGRHRRGLRRRRRGLRRELPHHAVRRRADRDHERRQPAGSDIDLAANLYFGIGSTIFVAILLTLITARIVEPRLGKWDPADQGEGWAMEEEEEISPEADERGLRWAMWGALAVLVGITLLTAIPGAPLRDPITDKVIGDSPFMDSLIVIITLFFFVSGYLYGRGAGTMKGMGDVIAWIEKSWAGLASLLFLFLLIAQFIAYFNFSQIPNVAAVKLGDVLEEMNIGAVWLLLGFVLVTLIVDLIIPQAIAKWALLAPIFIPLFERLDVAPQTVLAAYRVGDSPMNVVTPLMAYFPLIVIFVQRYRKDAGIGTVVALMLPYVIILTVLWTLFFVAWYLFGIPLGPGAPVKL